MALRPSRWLKRRARESTARQWAGFVRDADQMSQGRLRQLGEEADDLRVLLEHFGQKSDGRGNLHRAELAHYALPLGTDWRGRPDSLAGRVSPPGIAAPAPGTRLGQEATIWHDCDHRAVILRQVRNSGATQMSPYGLRLEVLGFSGSFLSVSIDLPSSALEGLTGNHILRVETSLFVETPLDIYARLNLTHGPNTEEVLRHLGGVNAAGMHQHVTEFDLAPLDLNETRLEKIWLDLIFDKPVMNAIEIRDLVCSRHPRLNV